MSKASRDFEYTEYVQARLAWLGRVAYLLCQDISAADELVQVTITRLYTRWGKAREATNLDAYTRTIMVREFLGDRRSAWSRRVTPVEQYFDAPDIQDDDDTRLDVRAALAALPPRQRATIVLRFYYDLSVDATAAELGVTPGTVKSQSSKGFEALRRTLGPIFVTEA